MPLAHAGSSKHACQSSIELTLRRHSLTHAQLIAIIAGSAALLLLLLLCCTCVCVRRRRTVELEAASLAHRRRLAAERKLRSSGLPRASTHKSAVSSCPPVYSLAPVPSIYAAPIHGPIAPAMSHYGYVAPPPTASTWTRSEASEERIESAKEAAKNDRLARWAAESLHTAAPPDRLDTRGRSTLRQPTLQRDDDDLRSRYEQSHASASMYG